MIAYKYRCGSGVLTAKGKDVFYRDIDLLAQNKIYIPTIRQLNDPTENLVNDTPIKYTLKWLSKFIQNESAIGTFQDAYREFRDIFSNAGIYSLSTNYASELMWAYYANGHRGYAIIFDTSILNASMNGTRRSRSVYEFYVKYVRFVPMLNISIFAKKDENSVIAKLLGTKSRAWRHESEYRLIFNKGGQILEIDYRAIKGIIFGALMSDNDIEYIMQKMAGRNLWYYQMSFDKEMYRFSRYAVKDKYLDTPLYEPHHVSFDFNELLQLDTACGGCGEKYQSFYRQALERTAIEPFVTKINSAIVTEEMSHVKISVWTNIKQDGVISPVKEFIYTYPK